VLSRRAALRTGLAVAVGLPLAGCDRPADVGQVPLRIASGETGGVYHAYATGVADAARRDLPGTAPQVLATAASVDNLRLVAGGRAEAGFALADSAGAAYAGRPPFGGALPVVALARLYDNYLHLVVRGDGPVTALAGLAGRRVSLGASGSGTELIASRLLASAGIDPFLGVDASRVGVDESAARFAAGGLDAFFFSAGLPVPAIAGLADRTPIRLLDLGDRVAPLRAAYGQFYVGRTIPASTYALGRAVRTVGASNYLVVGRTMVEPLAYGLTRLLFAERDRLVAAHPEARHLDRRTAIETDPLPLHPGAARYYREAKR
jgi:TRAP transporter TAXI family solute receptor